MDVLVIGGVAAGPKTAARIARLRPDARITLLEKGEFLSYAGCGLPYYVSGEVKAQRELMDTPAGVPRDAAFFRSVKNIEVRTGTEAVEIDRPGKRVRARDHKSGTESWLPYDKLVLATGAVPVIPPIPGTELGNVFTLHGIHDAEGIRALLAERKALDVVILGGGLIGVEATEALAAHGCRVTVVEMLPRILGMLDPEVARLVELHMESKGVRVLTGTRALALEPAPDDPRRVGRVRTEAGEIPAGMVIVATGVRPNVDLARRAGLAIGEMTRAIRVDDRLRTSDPDIHAAGDCAECTDRLTGRPAFVPLGSTANKHGRVAADNVCGVDSVFPGILGTAVCKVFDFAVARTGLTEAAARAEGFDVVTALAPGPDRAHYMPGSQPLLLKLVADQATGRLLGVQAVGPGDGAKRVDVAATAITAGMTLDDVAGLDLAYAPPYAPAMDNLITAANVARNKRSGLMTGITAEEARARLDRGDAFVFLDVRSPREHAEVRLPGSTLVPLGVLRKRLDEIPRDREIVTFCKVSLRGYEAARILQAAGFRDVKVLDGGVAMWPYAVER
ncbi:MAG: FAD-dependent oxidoreductase [Acidobacteria bacterium]|nr:FAD-dependent oxidoreductase [Acidobacteriota bacterium]